MQIPHCISLSLKKIASENLKFFFYIRIPQKVYTICGETGDGWELPRRDRFGEIEKG